jgi:hypothetical protein
MHMKATTTVRLILTLSIATAGCSNVGVEEPEEIGQTSENLYANLSNNPNGTYWFTSFPGQPGYVSVCFTSNASQNKAKDGSSLSGVAGFPGFANAKAWIRGAVENSWGRAANITFNGWDNICNSPNANDDNNRSANPNTVMFTFDPAVPRWSTDINGRSATGGTMIRIGTATTNQLDYQYRSIHEMGHALGLDHEQQRPDNWNGSTPKTCLSHNPGEGADPGGTYLTDFIDKNSVMCYDVSPSQLSPGDVMGIQKLYGYHQAGSIVGYGGKCAMINSDSTSSGKPIQSAGCVYQQSFWSSSWLSYFNQLTASPDGGTTRKSWNVSGGTVSTTSPTALISWDYGNFSNQVFKLANMRWKAIGDTCVTVDSAAAGAQLKIQPCGTLGKSERWDFWTNGVQIRLSGTNLCVAEPKSPAANGDPLALAACADVTTQEFDFSNAHEIKDAPSGRCANVFGGLPTPGSVVGMWDGCANSPRFQNELFHMSGRLVSAVLSGSSTGQCAIWKGNKTDDGTPAQVHACDAAPSPVGGWTPPDPQEWDLYWP